MGAANLPHGVNCNHHGQTPSHRSHQPSAPMGKGLCQGAARIYSTTKDNQYHGAEDLSEKITHIPEA